MTDTIAFPAPATTVRSYVEEVRAALADLPPDDIEELTGGLEGDLTERVAELPAGADLGAALGSAEAYAAELRSAAGLPARPAPGPPPRVSAWREAHRHVVAITGDVLGRHPWLSDLRPTWWLARGAVLLLGLALVLFRSSLSRWPLLLLTAAAAAVSFAWSRRAVASRPPHHRVLAGALDVLAIGLLPFVVATVLGFSSFGVGSGGDSAPVVAAPAGVSMNGETVTNLYAYDAAGRRVDGVRIFTQSGQKLAVSPDNLWGLPVGDPTDGGDGTLTVDTSVFPLHWGRLTGWESFGSWLPALTIPAADSASAPPTPSATSTEGSATTSAPSATRSPAPSATRPATPGAAATTSR